MESIDLEIWRRLRAIDDKKWGQVIQKLTMYALLKFNRYFQNPGKTPIPEGKDAKDLASEAIADVWTGERTWNIDRYPDILDFLKSAVDSKCYNLLKSADYEKRSREVIEDKAGTGLEEYVVSPNPSQEAELETSQTRELLWKCIEGEEDLELILACLEEEMKPDEIAGELNIGSDEAYNRLRKLRRHIHKMMPNLLNGGEGSNHVE